MLNFYWHQDSVYNPKAFDRYLSITFFGRYRLMFILKPKAKGDFINFEIYCYDIES